MSKITFRADDDLVDAVEGLDASKSEVMRDALRAYLGYARSPAAMDTLDAIVADRVDEALAERVADDEAADEAADDRDVHVTITVEPADGLAVAGAGPANERGHVRQPGPGSQSARTCAQCGQSVDADHVYCPNCGEKASRRVFCECGDEVRADWSFCPHCGRRTASADALEGSDRSR